jgi:hypothetical protein
MANVAFVQKLQQFNMIHPVLGHTQHAAATTQHAEPVREPVAWVRLMHHHESRAVHHGGTRCQQNARREHLHIVGRAVAGTGRAATQVTALRLQVTFELVSRQIQSSTESTGAPRE